MPKSHKEIKDLTMDKPYLSIGEVAEKFSVSTDLLRKWEKDFALYLRPRRTAGDNRIYKEKDLQQVAVIYRLLRVEGLSIDGAKRRMKGGNMSADESRQEAIQRLQRLRQRLSGMISELDNVLAIQSRTTAIGEANRQS